MSCILFFSIRGNVGLWESVVSFSIWASIIEAGIFQYFTQKMMPHEGRTWTFDELSAEAILLFGGRIPE